MKRIAAALAATLVTLAAPARADTTFSFDVPFDPRQTAEQYGTWGKLNLTFAGDDYKSRSYYGEDVRLVRITTRRGIELETQLPLHRDGAPFAIVTTDSQGMPTLSLLRQPQGTAGTTYWLLDESRAVDGQSFELISTWWAGAVVYWENHSGPALVSQATFVDGQAVGFVAHGVVGDVRTVVSEPPIAVLATLGLLLMRPLSRLRRRTS